MPEEAPFEELPFDADAIAAALAHVAVAQGDAASVAALAVSVPQLRVTGEDWYSHRRTDLLSLYLEVPIQAYGQLFRVREDIQERILAMLRPIIEAEPYYRASAVFIIPADQAPSNWREQVLAWLHGEDMTNQGRVRSDNIAARQYDGLLFRSQQEINLYRALKSAGISFAPLPVFVRGGKDSRRIEPDFIVVKGGMVAVIEVDGDTVHQESPVEAHARTTMLVHEGAHVERVKASDCDTPEKAKECAERILASLAKARASR
jgi:very-short-patch-repair endonuclease